MLVKTLASYINLDLWTKSLIFIVYVLLPAVLGKYGGSFRVCDQLSIGLRFCKAGGKQETIILATWPGSHKTLSGEEESFPALGGIKIVVCGLPVQYWCHCKSPLLLRPEDLIYRVLKKVLGKERGRWIYNFIIIRYVSSLLK